MKIVSLIPLRWGSKSIPYKNIKIIWWQPLCNRTINASLWSELINETRVSTDDDKIKEIALKAWAKVIDRPKEFWTDTASTESVMSHFMENINFDILVTIQATSPLTASKDLDSALNKFFDEWYDSMLTWVLTKRFFRTKEWKSLNYDFMHRPRRQEFGWTIMENGAFYITKKEILQKYWNRLWGNIWVYEMEEKHAIEIDEPSDWIALECLLSQNSKWDFKDIKVIFSDFDGVWTDNKVILNEEWLESLIFSKEDSLWLNYFKEKSNIPLIILSKERNKIIAKRCEKLQLDLEHALDWKKEYIENYLNEYNLNRGNVCYIWNDLNDLECIKLAGFSFCPSDANEEVKRNTKYILKHNWWNWAIRELLDLISN